MKAPARFQHPMLKQSRVIVPNLATARVICPGVKNFEQDCRELLYEAEHKQEELPIVQGALRVLERLFIEWLEQAPPTCLRHLAPKKQFVCGLTILYESYQHLAQLEEKLINQHV